jgi:hypothetical protein
MVKVDDIQQSKSSRAMVKSGSTMKKLEKSRNKMSGFDISAAILAWRPRGIDQWLPG